MRTISLVHFIKWASCRSARCSPLDKSGCNSYLDASVVAAPTRVAEFLNDIAFSKSTFEMDRVDQILTARKRGLARRMRLRI